MTNLNEMKAKELKEMAKNLNIKGYSLMKKDELITEIAFTIADKENAQNQPQDVEEVVPNEVIAEEEKTSQNESEKTEKKPRGKVIEYNGKSQTLNKWAEELGFAPQTLFARLYISNWPVEKAFSTPSRSKKKENYDD